MATSPDHPNLPFVQAAGYTKGRPDGPPLWVVVHDMEAGETRLRAENTAAYFASGAGGRSVSSHYCVDNDSVVQCVKLADTAWTVGNRPGNNRGINWEFSGFASQTREQWLDSFGLAMFAQAAPIIRLDMQRFSIPLRRCSVADLRAFRPGITSHNDLRLAFGNTTHTDPGPNFPWDVFFEFLEDDMADPATSAYAYNSSAILREMCQWAAGQGDGMANQRNNLGEPSDPIDVRPIFAKLINDTAAKVVQLLPPGTTGLSKADVEDAVRSASAAAWAQQQ